MAISYELPLTSACFPGSTVFDRDARCMLTTLSCSLVSIFYQQTILLLLMGIILAGKSLSFLLSSHPQCGVRAHTPTLPRIHLPKNDTDGSVYRDWAVGNATNQTNLIDTDSLTNTSTYQGQTSFNGYTYSTTVTYVSGLLQNTSDGVNHASDVAPPGRYAIDGLVSVFEAHIVARPTPVHASS